MITIKSDDVVGRVKVYESLVKGQPLPGSGIPESFRVLIKEFQALGLDITVLNEEGNYVELKELEEEEDQTSPSEMFENVVDENAVEEVEVPDEEDLTEDEFEEDFDDLEPDFEDLMEGDED